MTASTPLNVSTSCPACGRPFRFVGDIAGLKRSQSKAVLDLACEPCGARFELNMVTGQTTIGRATPVPAALPAAPPVEPPPPPAILDRPRIEDWNAGSGAPSTPAAGGFAPLLDHPEPPPPPRPAPPAPPKAEPKPAGGFAPLLDDAPPPAPKPEPRRARAATPPPAPEPVPPPPAPTPRKAAPPRNASPHQKRPGLFGLPNWAQWVVVVGAVVVVGVAIFALPIIPTRGTTTATSK